MSRFCGSHRLQRPLRLPKPPIRSEATDSAWHFAQASDGKMDDARPEKGVVATGLRFYRMRSGATSSCWILSKTSRNELEKSRFTEIDRIKESHFHPVKSCPSCQKQLGARPFLRGSACAIILTRLRPCRKRTPRRRKTETAQLRNRRRSAVRVGGSQFPASRPHSAESHGAVPIASFRTAHDMQ